MKTVLAAMAIRCAFAAASPAAARLTTATLPVSPLAGPAVALTLDASAVDEGGLASAPPTEERGRGRILVAGLSAGSDYLPVALLFATRAHAAVQSPPGYTFTPFMRITEGMEGSRC